jgi:hypothetical protein
VTPVAGQGDDHPPDVPARLRRVIILTARPLSINAAHPALLRAKRLVDRWTLLAINA